MKWKTIIFTKPTQFITTQPSVSIAFIYGKKPSIEQCCVSSVYVLPTANIWKKNSNENALMAHDSCHTFIVTSKNGRKKKVCNLNTWIMGPDCGSEIVCILYCKRCRKI